MSRKFFKKPIPVEAIQWTGKNIKTCLKFDYRISFRHTENNLCIYTLEGTMVPNVGDWIVKGSMDDVWFVKKEIFEATYEEIK